MLGLSEFCEFRAAGTELKHPSLSYLAANMKRKANDFKITSCPHVSTGFLIMDIFSQNCTFDEITAHRVRKSNSPKNPLSKSVSSHQSILFGA